MMTCQKFLLQLRTFKCKISLKSDDWIADKRNEHVLFEESSDCFRPFRVKSGGKYVISNDKGDIFKIKP